MLGHLSQFHRGIRVKHLFELFKSPAVVVKALEQLTLGWTSWLAKTEKCDFGTKG